MILFWDIHCTSAIIDVLIETMKTHVKNNEQEQSIVFLWDYVYHFSYDRKALLKLFRYFVSLAKQWKHVYVLAWNHDWISNHFVFSEWETLLEAFDWEGLWSWSLEFITTPQIRDIEWESVLFFPYTVFWENPWWAYDSLVESDNAHEQRSGRANNILRSMIDARKSSDTSWKELFIMHHWYINKTAFPWQFAQFSFRSPALSETFLDESSILMISWHLHQPFTHKNYVCCGSLWSTSPLEVNQMKYCFVLSRKNNQSISLEATEVHVNPYISLPFSWEQVSLDHIHDHIVTVRKDSGVVLQDWNFTVSIKDQKIDLSKATVFVLNEDTSSSDLQEYCNETVLKTVRDVKIKTKRRAMGELLEELHDASLSLDDSISDWKILLRRFLISRYWEEEAKQYETLLQTMKIV